MNIIGALKKVSATVSRDGALQKRALGLPLVLNGMVARRATAAIDMDTIRSLEPGVTTLIKTFQANPIPIDSHLQAAADFEQEVGGLLTILFALENESTDFRLLAEERQLLAAELGSLLGILDLPNPESQEAGIELYDKFSRRVFSESFLDKAYEYSMHIEQTRVQPGVN